MTDNPIPSLWATTILTLTLSSGLFAILFDRTLTKMSKIMVGLAGTYLLFWGMLTLGLAWWWFDLV